MLWKPAGLLRQAVELKKIEVKMLEEILQDRPDHPINMKRSFFSKYPQHTFSKSIRRRDGTLAIIPFMKRFQPPPYLPNLPQDESMFKTKLIHPLEDMAAETRSLWTYGVDSIIISTDTLKHGIEISEFQRMNRTLKAYGTPLPIVQHDIFIDPVQIAQAAEAGACCVNIVASAILDELQELLDFSTAIGIEAIVECHTKLEVEYAMECGATMLFLNDWDRTRNLLNKGNCKKLIECIPPFILVLAGGDLMTASECWDLLDIGFNGVVLGSSLFQSNRPKSFIEEIRGYKRYTGDMFTGDMGVPFSEGTNVQI